MNSTTNALVVSAILFGFLVAPSDAQEKSRDKITPTGTWSWVHKKKSGGKTDCELILVEKEGKVECTLNVGKRKFVSKKGSFKDGVFAVTFSTKNDEGQYGFEGKLKGRTLRGKYTSPDTGDKELDWKAKKIVGLGEVVGKWSLYFETPDGNSIEPTFELSQDDDGNPVVVFGSQNGQPAIEATETIFKNGVLTVVTVVDFQGNELDAEWEIKLKGDSARGVLYFSFRDNDNEGELAIEGERIK